MGSIRGLETSAGLAMTSLGSDVTTSPPRFLNSVDPMASASKLYLEIGCYASVGGATGHTVVVLCICVCVCLSVGRISRRSQKTKR